jgi:CRISPR-associated endonuclease/helicase Cas3
MQQTVASLVGNEAMPSLLFIEDSCGGGKTEAAMYYALTQAKHANGIYFALPTTATSENMRRRIDEICKSGIDSDFKVPVYNSMAWMQDDDVRLDNNLWQNDTKLKLFYPIAVGTVDQLLMSVQGIKYSDLGLIALSNKVLIIDEMHAYDAYMLEELKILFSYCALMGVTIIVLSATMTSDTKKQLMEAYNHAKGTDTVLLNGKNSQYKDLALSQQYPLVTKVTKEAIEEVESPISKNTTYEYEMFSTDYRRFKADTDKNRNHKSEKTVEYLHCLIKK